MTGVLGGLAGLDRVFGLLVRGALLAWWFRKPRWSMFQEALGCEVWWLVGMLQMFV